MRRIIEVVIGVIVYILVAIVMGATLLSLNTPIPGAR